MVVVVVLVVAITLVGVVVFLRAVFGGSTFPRARDMKGDGDGRGPRADAHPGAGTWPGGGGLGRFGTWSD